MYSHFRHYWYAHPHPLVELVLILGFGDFSPETPAGRVFFIPFVLLAVPIVTSFAVQTITGLVRLTYLREQR
jgi:hypothetical protein